MISFISFCGFSQSDGNQYPNFIGQDLTTIMNSEKWEILDNATGDLNNDGISDSTLILQSKDSIVEKRCESCYRLKAKPRIIIVLLNEHNKSKVITQNNTFIARGDEGGMLPYLEPELSIKDGQLTIFYQYTRSNQSYTFELKGNEMVISSAESNGVHSASGNFENDKFYFSTQEILSTTGNISDDNNNTIIIRFNIKPKSLSEFNEMYDWEIAENKYL
jgi:hypothetical protein